MFKTKRLHKFIALFISVMFIFSPLANVLPTVIFAEEGTDTGDADTPTSTSTSSEWVSSTQTSSFTFTSQTPSTASPQPNPLLDDGTQGGTPSTKSQREIDEELINSLGSVEAITLWQSNPDYYYPLLTGDNKAAVDEYIIYIQISTEVNSFTDMAELDAFLKDPANIGYESFLADDKKILLEEYRTTFADDAKYNAELAIAERIASYTTEYEINLDAEALAFLNGNRTTAALADYLITRGYVYVSDGYDSGAYIYSFIYKNNIPFTEGVKALIRASLNDEQRVRLDSYKAQYDLEMYVITYIFERMITKTEIEYYGKNADEATSNAVNRILYPDNPNYGTLTYALADFLEIERLTVYFPVYETGENIYNSLYKTEAPNKEVICVLKRASLTPENRTALDTYMQTLADDEANYNAEMSVIKAIAMIATDEAYDAYYNTLSDDVRVIVDRILSGNAITLALADYLAENGLTCILTDSNELYYFFKNYDEEYTAGQLILIQASLSDVQKARLAQGEADHVYIPPVPYTNAAPIKLKAAVTPITRMFFSTRSGYSPLDVDGNSPETNSKGLVTAKKVEANGDNYKITLEAYTTGDVRTTVEKKGYDIIFVVSTSASSDNLALAKQVQTFLTKLINSGLIDDANTNVAAIGADNSGHSGTPLTKAGFHNINDVADLLTEIGKLKNQSNHSLLDEALDTANTQITNRKNQSVVIVITDVPTGKSNKYESEVASNAIDNAIKIKNNNNSYIYTINMHSGADAEDFVDGPSFSTTDIDYNMNKLMQYISSNYDANHSLDYSSINETPETKGYALSVGSAITLETAFTNLVTSFTHPIIELGAETVVRDVLSDYFELVPPSSSAAVKTYTSKYLGKANGWAQPEIINTLTVQTSSNTIDVNGFNFDENYIIDDPKGELKHKDGSIGKKLIIEIIVTPKAEFLGGNNVETNIKGKSGIFWTPEVPKGTEEKREWVGGFTLPHANVPLEYEFSLKDQHIYLSNGISSIIDRSVNLVNGEPVATKFTDPTVMLGKVARADDYVTVKYVRYISVNGGAESLDDELPVDEDTTLSKIEAFFTPTVSGGFTDDKTTYRFEVILTPTEEAKSTSATPNDYKYADRKAYYFPNEKGENATIYVSKPTITWQDISVNPGDPVTLANQIAKDADDTLIIKWNCDAEGTKPDVSGVIPTLSYEFTVEGYNTSTGIINPTAEVQVDVTEVWFKGTANTEKVNYTTHVKFKWQPQDGVCDKKWECDGAPTVGYDDNDKTCRHSADKVKHATHEYTIHMLTFTLTITKKAGTGTTISENESFIFHIVGTDSEGTIIVDIYEVIQGADVTKTINNLLHGNYTVTEQTDWSWRYTSSMTIDKISSTDGIFTSRESQHDIVVTNEKTEHSWLSGDSWAVNTFYSEGIPDNRSPKDTGETSTKGSSSPSLMNSPTTVTTTPAPSATLPFSYVPSLIPIPDAAGTGADPASPYGGVYSRNVIRPRP